MRYAAMERFVSRQGCEAPRSKAVADLAGRLKRRRTLASLEWLAATVDQL